MSKDIWQLVLGRFSARIFKAAIICVIFVIVCTPIYERQYFTKPPFDDPTTEGHGDGILMYVSGCFFEPYMISNHRLIVLVRFRLSTYKIYTLR